MPRLSIATWNINSVRLRLPLVEAFLAAEQPDVLCLQETKCPEAEFPTAAFARAGYGHVHAVGQKGYNGVAILSRWPLEAAPRRGWAGQEDARHAAAMLLAGPGAGITLHNFYVPAGGDVADPAANPKFAHKLAFLDDLAAWAMLHAATRQREILLGDLNIAPLEHDVWDHRALLTVVSHTPVETSRLEALRRLGRFIDVARHLVPEPAKLYSWWSYRAADWAASDRGRRLDHIWASADLGPSLAGIRHLREARGWERPSDHVPVVATLEL